MKYHAQNIVALAVIVTLGFVGYYVLVQSNIALTLPLTNVSSKSVTPNTVTSSSLPSETGTWVDSFIDTQAVNIHSSYLSTPYASAGAVTNALGALHIHNVRDNVAVSPSPTEVANINSWIIAGIKFDFGIGAADQTRAAPLVSEITGHGQAASTIGVEGPNEASNSSTGPSDSSWVAADRAAQSALYSSVRGTSSLGGARIVGPSITGIHDGNLVAQNGWNDTALLGNLTGVIDVGNVHAYPGAGKTPESTIAGHLSAEASVSGSKTIWATETGYNDCLASTCSNSPGYVSQSDQATLDPRIFLTYFQHGVGKTFMYELFNEANGGTNFQDYWGLVNNSGSLKPSGQAIANMNNILIGGSNHDPASNPSLSYSLAGDGLVQHQLFDRSSGGVNHYLLAVWENQLPGPQSSAVTLSFAQGMNLTKYTPVTTANAVSSVSGVTSYHDTVGPAVTIYDLTVAPVVTPTCPSGQTGTPPNCVTSGSTPGSTTGGSTGGTSSTSTTNSGGSGVTQTVTAVSLGSASTPIKASSVTLTPQTTLPLKDIVKVEYLVDGKVIATVTKAPFTYNLTNAQIKNGCHSVSTIVYATIGPTTQTNRQVCVALTASHSAVTTWGIGLGSLLIAALLALEFVPFYPKRSHLVSRTVIHLWNKIHPNSTPPAPPAGPPSAGPPSGPRRPESPFVPMPGEVIQPGQYA